MIGSSLRATIALSLCSAILAGCGHRVCCNSYTYGPPSMFPIVVSPSGTAANPVGESISGPFTLTATEQNYTGNLTVQVFGSCFTVPNTNGQGFAVVAAPATIQVSPNGSTCQSGKGVEIDKITLTDSFGQTTSTYIRAT